MFTLSSTFLHVRQQTFREKVAPGKPHMCLALKKWIFDMVAQLIGRMAAYPVWGTMTQLRNGI